MLPKTYDFSHDAEIRRTVNGKETKTYAYTCLCDCGKEITSLAYALLNKATISCGCKSSELSRERLATGHNELQIAAKQARSVDSTLSFQDAYAYEKFLKENREN
jgi:hypothetical protein